MDLAARFTHLPFQEGRNASLFRLFKHFNIKTIIII